MSQQLTPITGGVEQIQTALTKPEVRVLSRQYKTVNNLESRPTEWVPGGRPIYRRLPAVSETYQVDFFADGEIGYVYTPWGQSTAGPYAIRAEATQNKKELSIQGGNIVWKYGSNPVYPALVDFEQLGVQNGRYVVSYSLLYDDSPSIQQYSVENFSLTGYPVGLYSSTSNISGWRYREENAFLNTDGLFWSNYDNSFTSYPQPTSAFLSWSTPNPAALTEIVLRQPSGTIVDFLSVARLEVLDRGEWFFVSEATVSSDSQGPLFKFIISNPSFVSGWRVTWTNPYFSAVPKVYIQNVSVTGVITLPRKTSSPRTLATLVMYPEYLVPQTTTNSLGIEVPAVYCDLAFVEVNNVFEITSVQDTRYIIHRDYKPIASWLTEYWDSNLINLYEQVKNYPETWMNPQTCLKQEYVSLAQYGILDENNVPFITILPS